MSTSQLETTLLYLIRANGLPEPLREYRWHAVRHWKADFAYPENRLLIEIEGGVWTRGRHTRGQGFIDDCIKYNTATLDGWCVLRFTGDMIESGHAVECIKKAIGAME